MFIHNLQELKVIYFADKQTSFCSFIEARMKKDVFEAMANVNINMFCGLHSIILSISL